MYTQQQITINVTILKYISQLNTGEIKRATAFCLTQSISMSLLGKHKQFNTDDVFNINNLTLVIWVVTFFRNLHHFIKKRNKHCHNG